jgi:hypothetical protein
MTDAVESRGEYHQTEQNRQAILEAEQVRLALRKEWREEKGLPAEEDEITEVPESRGAIAIVVPSHDGRMGVYTTMGLIQAVMNVSSARISVALPDKVVDVASDFLAPPLQVPIDNIQFSWPQQSLITRCFNNGWAAMLNFRPSMTRWLMLHSDVGPLAPTWLNIMLETMDAHGLHVLSAVVPIKDDGGLTSTAHEDPDGTNVKTYTEKELKDLPETFSDKWLLEEKGQRLLINTGLMLVDWTQPWVEEFHFELWDNIEKDPATGTWGAVGFSEDWIASRWFSARGIPYGVTQTIPVLHVGPKVWRMG